VLVGKGANNAEAVGEALMVVAITGTSSSEIGGSAGIVGIVVAAGGGSAMTFGFSASVVVVGVAIAAGVASSED